MELKDQADLWSAQAETADTPNNGPEIADTPTNRCANLFNDDTPPKQAMWEKILMDYTPSDHPSHIVSPPRPGTNWADWSDTMGREMYLRRALDRLNFEYPSDDAA
jgi:hypothetical protein